MDDSSRTANDLAVFRAFEVTRYTRPLPARDRRQLRRTAAYTDDEEVLFQPARPILLNGIEEVVSRPDLGDRAIFLTLAPIGEAQRRPESASSKSRGPASWAPCSTRWCMACGRWVVFTSTRCRAWQTSRSGPPLAKQRCGLPARSPAPTRQTAERPSKASSKQIP